jgi:uncharacterized protein
MLILSLNAVARGEVPVVGEISPADPVWEDADVALAEPLRVQMRARFVGEGVLARGRMRTRLDLECRRCLTAVGYDIDDAVDLLYEPLAGEEEEVALSGEVYPLPPRGDQIDLKPALREQLLLRVPDHVVCDEACRGLCPQCGTDLNRETCSCVPVAASGPWDALRKLKFD